MNQSLKVYINARFLTQQITGVQQFAFEICRYLQQGSIDFVLLTPRGYELPQELKHLEHLTIGKQSGYLWEQIELPAFLKKQGSPLLINFCNTAPLLYKNQWVTIHDLAFIHHPEWFSKSFARVYRFLIPRIAKRSAKVFTVSNTVATQLHNLLRIPKTKIDLLYNGISYDLLQKTRETTTRQKTILTVSSINPRKNLDTLINAFTEANLSDYELVIVGAKNSVFAEGKQSNTIASNISFVGYIDNDELFEQYQKASLFVSLSYDEGFGIPVLESLYCGCPVLLSNIDVYKECFGDVALFTNPFDATKVAEDIRKALKHPPIASSIDNMLVQYSYPNTAKKLMKLVKENHEKM